jgi:putative hydrolase of the HAD superfamily
MQGRVNIRAISFDVGGTLLEPWPSVGHVYADVAGRFGISDVAPEALNRAFGVAWKARKDFDYSRAAWRRLVVETFAEALAPAPDGACFDAIYEHFAGPVPWRVFDDVLPTLTSARERGLKLAVVSNWDERLGPLLEALDIARHFDVVVSSHSCGHTKPAGEIFLRAAEMLGFPAESVLHIGDSRAEDFDGAQSAGLAALWLDRSGRGVGAVGTLAAVLGNGR